MASTPESQPESIPESIPERPDAYHKARRQFALYSGVLLAWEYVGISIGQLKGGENGAHAINKTASVPATGVDLGTLILGTTEKP